MTNSQPKSGYTLPVFACAAAIAALQYLRKPQTLEFVSIDLIQPPEITTIPIEQVSAIRQGMVLAITRSNPGDNLDITRNTPIWALVEWGESKQTEQVSILGGEGIGKNLNVGGKAAIYTYAEKLLQENLKRHLIADEKIQVTIILPEGRSLAERTSNAAFGVVEGLSLLGTTGISQPLSAPGQLEAFRAELQQKAHKFSPPLIREEREVSNSEFSPSIIKEDRELSNSEFSPSLLRGDRGGSNSQTLVFCVGENGLDLAQKLGINPEQTIKTANWLGPLLVEAGLQKIPAILLFGYHGKLIKLAGGIFHTHHHLADARLEIITSNCAAVGMHTPFLQEILASTTAEEALQYLRKLDATEGSDWVNQVYGAISCKIDVRSQEYIRKLSDQEVLVGSILFDRDRQIITSSKTGATLLSQLC